MAGQSGRRRVASVAELCDCCMQCPFNCSQPRFACKPCGHDCFC